VKPDEIPPIEFPPGYDDIDLSDLRHSAFSLPALGPAKKGQRRGGSDYRRDITADSPLKFAITYFSDWLIQEETWQMSFCRLHLGLCLVAQEWIRPGPSRHAWIAPRMSGKSPTATATFTRRSPTPISRPSGTWRTSWTASRTPAVCC
jgi:hypothetical protein